jgi:hypothetical protein
MTTGSLFVGTFDNCFAMNCRWRRWGSWGRQMGAGGRLTEYATPEVARDDANDVDFSYEGAASRFGYYVSSIVRKNSSAILTLLPRLSAVGFLPDGTPTLAHSLLKGCVTSDGHARRDLVGSLGRDLLVGLT